MSLSGLNKMKLLVLLVIGSAFSKPNEDISSSSSERDNINLTKNVKRVKHLIIPSVSYHSSPIQPNDIRLLDVIDKNHPSYKKIIKYYEKGYMSKGLTFNIYDSNIFAATTAVFSLVQKLRESQLKVFKLWAEKNINKDMYDYICRLNQVYSNNTVLNDRIHEEPPYITKPNYFVNSETIFKAFKVKLNHGLFTNAEGKVMHMKKTGNLVTINTNYSGWNLHENGCDEELNYFREDIGLNSFYYGVHLLHPFWMSVEELDKINARHGEHYYFAHQQLLARYYLEREHLKDTIQPMNVECMKTFNPNLIYDNGLPFPTRTKFTHKLTNEAAEVKEIDILLKECIARGILIMDNGTVINMTEVEDINLMARFVLRNLDSIKSARKFRVLYGDWLSEEYMDKYNPAPSIMYNHMTAMRDTTYWNLIKFALVYFAEYKAMLRPFDMSYYEDELIRIGEASIPDITTTFEYFQFGLDKLFDKHNGYPETPIMVTARQKRLKYYPFSFNFTVHSDYIQNKIVNVKLFLGPKCYHENCWEHYDKFFLLDSYNTELIKGINFFIWNPATSEKLSFDDYYNKEERSTENRYNIFKFPNNLLFPRGLEGGLQFTLFVMITNVENDEEFPMRNIAGNDYYYNRILSEDDRRPIGFPFHRKAINANSAAKNYRFFNISIYHNKKIFDGNYFSHNLY